MIGPQDFVDNIRQVVYHLDCPVAGPGAFPHAERAASEILTLPLFPGITPAQQERVVATLAGLL